MRNWQLKVLGLFIAGTTWTVVAYAGNPPTAESFKGIVLEHGQPPSGLVLIKEPAPVTVTVRGLQSSLSNFHKESLHAVIDLAGAHKGSNLLPVRVRVDSPDQSVMFAAVDPDNAEVVLDQLATVQRKVDVRVHGTPNSCCLAGAGTASPDTVTAPAKQQLLGEIGRAQSELQSPDQLVCPLLLEKKKDRSATHPRHTSGASLPLPR